MKVKIDKSRKVYKGNLNSGRINENKYEVLEFEFPQELEDFTKYIEIEATDNEGTLRYADRIEDNEFAIDNTLSKYSLITAQIVCKDLRENIVFKSNPFEFTFEQSLNIMEDIEEEQQDLLDRIELELQETKEDITDLQETQEQHTEQIQTNETNIEDLQGRVTTNETDIANIKTKNTQQDTEIGTNTQDISNIKTEQTTQNTNIASNTNRITVLEAQSGNKVTLSINSNYVMTLQLLNKNNGVLSTATIDLPIESMIVNASYSNGILTLTLQNGQTLDVDISDIVSGLVSETTFNSAVSELQSAITALQGKMATAETNITTLQTNVATNTQDITEIKTEQTTQDENIQENTDSIEALETKHDTEVAELQSQIEDLQAENQALEDQIPIGNASGSHITLSDSAGYKFKKMVFGGKSEQTQYTGKNKFQVTATSQTINGIEYTINEDGTIKANGTATAQSQLNMGTFNFEANTSYILNGCPAGGSTSTYRQIISGGSSEYGEGVNVSYEQDTENSIYIRIMSGVTVNNLVFKPMIRLASVTDDSYEPYVGGKPSPNTNYTQPINNITGNINIKIKSKNWLNNRATSTVVNGINYTVNSDKTILCNGTATANAILVVQTYAQSDLVPAGDYKISIGNALPSNNSFLRVEASTNKSTAIQTFDVKNMQTESTVTLNQASYLKISLLIANTYTANNLLIKPMIREVSIINDIYQPHDEQNVVFPLASGQVLREDDTIEDKIYQRRKTVIFDGTENWKVHSSTWHRYYIEISDVAKGGGILSNYFTREVKLQDHNREIYSKIDSGYYSSGLIFIQDFTLTTLQDFKDWLAEKYSNGTPVIVEYELDTPVEIEFTQEQTIAKAQIDELHSYKAGTHIISNANLDITYVKDFDVYEKVTDDRLAELEARLELLEG